MSGSDDWGPDNGASLAIQRSILKDSENERGAVQAAHDHLLNEITVLKWDIERLQEKEELAWGLIANAWSFVQDQAGQGSDDWVEAAERWRDSFPLDLGVEPDQGPIQHEDFHCPDCNGTHFGTSNMDGHNGPDWIVHCHGDDDRPQCGWSGLHRDHVPGSGRGLIE